jgi:hypothetical protein
MNRFLIVVGEGHGLKAKADPDVHGNDLGGPGPDEGERALVFDGHDVRSLVGAVQLQNIN